MTLPLPLALITGAGRRLGRAIALELARQGFAIAMHYRSTSTEEAAQAAAEITALGMPVYPFTADLSDPAQIDDLFARVAELPHPLRVLVNSAGVMPRGDLREMPVEEWDRTMAVNLRAPWLCARAAAKLMEAGGGVVVNISDSGARKAWTGYPAYIISKAALETLTRLLAKTLAPAVRVNAVAPGLILPSADRPPEQWQRLVDRLPLRAAGQPADVAAAVLFFVTNPYVTGQVLAVDGGYQLV